MLGKCLKYEFSATWRIFLPAYAALLLFSLISGASYGAEVSSAKAQVFVTIIMVMLFTAVWIITIVMVLRRYWTNLLGREGYLTNVLPVPAWQQVLTKLLVSLVWCVCGTVVSLMALGAMLWQTIAEWSILTDIGEFVTNLVGQMQQNGLLADGVLFVVLLALNSLFSLVSGILMIYTAMSIGQLANRHRVWAAIGAYFGMSIVLSAIRTWLPAAGLTTLTLGLTTTAYSTIAAVNSALALGLCEELVLTAAFFAAPSVILQRRLNLQ